MKKLLFTLGIIAVLSGLAFAIASLAPAPEERSANGDFMKYFVDRLQGRFIALVGQPIEGFVPEMLTQVWPGLEESDFDGAEAMGGSYEFENGELAFVRQEGGPITSADGAITGVGFQMLLRNLAVRYQMDIDDGGDVDRLLGLLLAETLGENTATIRGKAVVGPACPVEEAGVPCTVPPAMYTSRAVTLTDEDGREITRQNLKADGTYEFRVPPGSYVLDIAQSGVDTSAELPEPLEIKAGEVLDIDFSVDTGVR